VLETIPEVFDQKCDKDFSDIKAVLQKIRVSPKVRSGPQTLQNDVDGLVTLIGNLVEGRAPPQKEFSKLNNISKTAFKKLENAFEIDVIIVDPGAKQKKAVAKGVQKKLRGAEAVQHVYSEVESAVTNKEAVKMDALRPLKQFRWVLSGKQQQQLHLWFQHVSQSQCSGILQKAALKNATESSTSIVPVPSSSSSSHSCCAAIVRDDLKSKKDFEKEQVAAGKKRALMDLFKPTAKKAR